MGIQARELAHNEYQRWYYADPLRRGRRMAPVRSRYVLRHFHSVLESLRPGSRILELGCGMGRFTLLLLEQGFEVTAVDLSPQMLGVLERHTRGRAVDIVCCDAAEVDRHVEGPFDAAVGFFFLHHLPDLDRVLSSLAATLQPGGRVAFCEPNGYNPLFYLQILITPGMTWRGDGGVRFMRRRTLFAALEGAGFREVHRHRYGLFPPFIANTRIGGGLEDRLEHWTVLRPLLAFQVLSGTVS